VTTQDLTDRITMRLGDDPAAAQPNRHYTYGEVLAWLNAAHRLFCLLTLCLEKTVTYPLTNGVAWYNLLATIPDWLVPLRVRITGGAKVRPARLEDLAALDVAWSTTSGTPIKYAVRGFGLLAIYHPPATTTSLDITFARCPTDLVLSTDVPESPAAYHPALIDGAIVLCRAKEGAQEFDKVRGLLDSFLGEAQKLGDYVRARSKEKAYDRMPFELAKFDRSRLIKEVAK
jgi:hypothetical protein